MTWREMAAVFARHHGERPEDPYEMADFARLVRERARLRPRLGPGDEDLTGPSELLDQGPILRALRDGAVVLAARALPTDAPPAFLLDSRRQSVPRPLRPGMLDNRWQVFPEDFPSAQLLGQRGVSRVIWVGHGKPQDDLARVLRVWQEAHVALEAKDLTMAGPPRPLILPPPSWWRHWWDRLRSWLGLQGRPRDGFGCIVPARTHG